MGNPVLCLEHHTSKSDDDRSEVGEGGCAQPNLQVKVFAQGKSLTYVSIEGDDIDKDVFGLQSRPDIGNSQRIVYPCLQIEGTQSDINNNSA
ncbi:hypothetical protein SDC9_87182 [bioreactor metagenome]|uniref:Uncharacterized protein n=1 Tax=bioreactor metagenome TaxID=1076179 RepID=A0A644ZJN6_9ZZZZ